MNTVNADLTHQNTCEASNALLFVNLRQTEGLEAFSIRLIAILTHRTIGTNYNTICVIAYLAWA